MKRKVDENAHQYLLEKLGDYFSQRELVKKNFSIHTLNVLKKDHGLIGVRVLGQWFYSKNSLAEALKRADTKTLSYHTPKAKKTILPPDLNRH